MKKWIRKTAWPFYFCAMLVLAAVGIVTYLDATSILRNHTEIEAPIQLVDTSTRTKKGHTTTTYHFEYRYTVGAEEFSQPVSAVNEQGEHYLDEQTIRIAYSNEDPELVGALDVLQRQADLMGLIRRLMTGGAILGVITFLLYVWASKERALARTRS